MTERERKTLWQREDYKKNPHKYIRSAKTYRDKNRNPKKLKPVRTHCKVGHELVESNVYTYVSTEGHTVTECKRCATLKNRRRASQLRNSHLQRKFGITIEQYEGMLAAQDGRCATCATDTPGGMGSFHVDHDHRTGAIRQLLCMRCNRALGAVDDDKELLRTLIAYLERHQ